MRDTQRLRRTYKARKRQHRRYGIDELPEGASLQDLPPSLEDSKFFKAVKRAIRRFFTLQGNNKLFVKLVVVESVIAWLVAQLTRLAGPW